jgi:AcrR family transcriptional regulator
MVDRTAPRDRILRAALHELAEHGYPGCSLRAVAHRAGVDARLIGHYFTGKEQVCAEALRPRCAQTAGDTPVEGRPGAWPGVAGAVGITAALLGAWDTEWPAGQALVAAALTHETSVALLRGVLTGLLEQPLKATGAGQRERRTAMAASLFLGLALLSRAGVAGTDPPSRPVAAGLKHYLDVLLRERLT